MSALAENKQEAPAEPTQELVKLSLRAAEKVKAIRAEEKIEEGYGLRLKVMGGGCSGFAYDLFFDQPQEIDQSFESQGVKMLCDQMSLMYLVGTEIDYVESVQGSGFKFTNPNVKSTCGCGSSFSV
jgi:iron-sulfur cluster insertion protein